MVVCVCWVAAISFTHRRTALDERRSGTHTWGITGSMTTQMCARVLRCTVKLCCLPFGSSVILKILPSHQNTSCTDTSGFTDAGKWGLDGISPFCKNLVSQLTFVQQTSAAGDDQASGCGKKEPSFDSVSSWMSAPVINVAAGIICVQILLHLLLHVVCESEVGRRERMRKAGGNATQVISGKHCKH